jgi:hypothetical protein
LSEFAVLEEKEETINLRLKPERGFIVSNTVIADIISYLD